MDIIKENNKTIEETTLLPISIEQKGIVYQDRYKKIEKIIARFDGFDKEYFVSDFGEKAAVLVVKNGEVLLARQYRLLTNSISYEIPGGKINENENPQDAAVRECLEETGVKCFNLKPLISYNPDLEYSKNYTHIFYSNEAEEVTKNSTDKYEWVPLKDCIDKFFSEKRSDSLSIIALLSYHILVNGY